MITQLFAIVVVATVSYAQAVSPLRSPSTTGKFHYLAAEQSEYGPLAFNISIGST